MKSHVHEYRMACKVCDQLGSVQLTIVPECEPEVGPDVHVWPRSEVHDTEHGLGCWCKPYRDRVDPLVVIHRREGRA